MLQHVYTGRGRVAFLSRRAYAFGNLSSFQVTSYFPDQDSLVTVLRYKVVIDEIVVSKKKFDAYNSQKEFNSKDELVIPVEDFLETEDNGFQDWQYGTPSAMANPRVFVGEAGEGYVAFHGDVTSATDDLFPMSYNSWSHDSFSPIPFGSDDYFASLGKPQQQ